ncbi:uncharacterized protein LOC106173644, partial [Lingula anatina]|uniref:Uncharacterized protein LOC106173644 n=1 Tax=Lingula anatina TaxID=7574 RepID=A0A1S3JIU5_LINAN
MDIARAVRPEIGEEIQQELRTEHTEEANIQNGASINQKMELESFVEKHGLGPETKEKLLTNGFSSQRALDLLRVEDIREIGIQTLGERRLLEAAIISRNNPGNAEAQPHPAVTNIMPQSTDELNTRLGRLLEDPVGAVDRGDRRETYQGTSAREEHLDKKIQHYRSLCYADSTKRTYSSFLRSYFHFCASMSYVAFPADNLTLCRYVAHLAEKLHASSIPKYLAVIRIIHLEMGLDNPIQDNWALKTVLRGIQREKGL